MLEQAFRAEAVGPPSAGDVTSEKGGYKAGIALVLILSWIS